MCIVCQTLEDYYKSYDGGLYNDLVNDITVNKLLDYFSYIEEVQKKCNNEIKKLAYTEVIINANKESKVCLMPSCSGNATSVAKQWLESKCFFLQWADFKMKILNEKNRINIELAYSCSSH